MSQLNAGDWPIDSDNTSGNDLADILNRLSAAVRSGFAGSSRPLGAVRGMPWVRQFTNGDLALMIYDGAADIEALRISGGKLVLSGAYSRAETDQKIAALQSQIDSLDAIPIGGIIMWSGAQSAIPAGWRLCNGGGGTPDLRNRFVVGAGLSYAVGQTGGVQTQVQVPNHAHDVEITSEQDGEHNHGVHTEPAGGHDHSVTYRMVRRAVDFSKIAASSSGPEQEFDKDYPATYYGSGFRTNWPKTEPAPSHRHVIKLAGLHGHIVRGTTRAFGNVNGVENRPPYYALCYIMKFQ